MLHTPSVAALPIGRRGVAMVPTPLSQRLAAAGTSGEVVHAFRRARAAFIAGERLDMTALAAQMGVDRTSLFRWVGNRDALLSEVLWSLAEPTLDRIAATERSTGPDRVVAVLTRFTGALIQAPYFRQFLRTEPVRALKLLTTAASEVQRRFVATVESMLADEEAAGLQLTLPAHDLAYLLVRVAESFTFADLIAGERPDTDRAAAALAHVMRTDVPARPRVPVLAPPLPTTSTEHP